MENNTLETRIKVNKTPNIEQIRQKKSRLTTNQKEHETKIVYIKGKKYQMTVNVRYDDECHNGHNSFSITLDVYRWGFGKWVEDSFGCQHDLVAKYFPKLTPYIKWHLMDSDSPKHYIANALYWKEKMNDENLKSTIIYGVLESDYQTNFIGMGKLKLQKCLEARLPLLVKEFRKAIESLGFIY